MCWRPSPLWKLLEPARLAHRVVVAPARIDMHDLNHVLSSRVGSVVVNEVVACDRTHVACHAQPLGSLRQPGVIVPLQVPDMDMGVDDWLGMHQGLSGFLLTGGVAQVLCCRHTEYCMQSVR